MRFIWAGVTWASAEYFLILGIVLCAVGFLLLHRFTKRNRSVAILSDASSSRTVAGWRRHLAKLGFVFLAVTSIAFALLRPQWGQIEEDVPQRGREVLIALDVSRSMLAGDCLPDRLSCAKQKIKQLLSQLTCERVGLILFAGAAFVQCPLTADFGAFSMFLDQVDSQAISSGSTSLDQAIRVALDQFSDRQERKSKLLVIMTDGEDFSSDLHRYKAEAIAQGMHIFTMGFGTAEGAPIPLFDARGNQVGHQRDGKGAVVISRLNEGILSTLSEDVGGSYVRLAQDATDVNHIVSQLVSFEKEDLGREVQPQMEDRYHWFLFVALISCAVEWLL